MYAGEKIRLATDQAHNASRRANTTTAALDSLREEYDTLQLRVDAQDEEVRNAKLREQKLMTQISEVTLGLKPLSLCGF